MDFEALLVQANERADSAATGHLESLRYVISLIKSHSEPSDPGPYSAIGLQAVNQGLSQMSGDVRNYVANGNAQHLVNAVNYGDQVLNNLGSWPGSILKGGAAAQANKVFLEYRESAEAALMQLREKNDELQAQLDAQQSESQRALSDLQTEVTALSAKITQDEARLDTALTNNNEAFTSKQTEREEKFKEFVTEQGANLEKLAGKSLKKLESLAERGQETYATIDDLREGTEKVAGLASADILAGKFKEYSDQQWKWGVGANALGFVALAIGLGVIAWTLHSVGINDEVSWQYTTLKLGVTVTIVAASAVAFRLGSLFLSRSSTSKRMELELRAIGPFFADIEDEAALMEAKKAFVERSFGRGWGDKSKADKSASGEETNALVRELVELVKAVTSRTS